MALLAGYNLNGNANDFSGNGKDGTVLGAIFVSPGVVLFSQCIEHDGNDDRVNLPTIGINNESQTFTLATWVNFNTTGIAECIICNGTFSDPNEYYVSLRREISGQLYCRLGMGGVWNIEQLSNANILSATGTAYHVGVTYDGSSLNTGIKLYAGGALIASTAGGAGVPVATTPQDDWILGNNSALNIDMNGKQTQALIYSDVKDATWFSSIYNGGAGIDISPGGGNVLMMRAG